MSTPTIHKRSDRMRSYEDQHRQILPAKSYTVLRVDGRAFHTLTRDMTKPFDPGFIQAMDDAAVALCEEIQGCQFAYIQSDEISLLLTDFASMQQPWFGGVVQKMCSISAAIASNAFRDGLAAMGLVRSPVFDSRVFTVPNRAEAINYFLFRQADCHRNAVSMVAEHHLSSKQLLGKPVSERLEMLAAKGVHMEQHSAGARLGRVVVKENFEGWVTYTRKDTGATMTELAVRSRWVVEAADWFDWDHAGFLERYVPDLPSPTSTIQERP